MVFHQSFAKMLTFFFIILVGTSELWDVLFNFNLWISFSILAKSISSKANFIRFLQMLWIARMLRWSLYFGLALKVGSLALFTTGSKFEYWLISKFFTKFPKKVFKTSAVSKSVSKISSFFYQINLLFDAWFILKWRLYYFQKEPIVRHFFFVNVYTI